MSAGGPIGVLVVDKHAGCTSFDVVRRVRRLLRVRKAGHTGTLDPMATGVLPVCVGAATKIAGLLSAEDKEYRATALLGQRSDTLDVTGRIERCEDPSLPSRDEIERVLEGFRGEILQVPPAFSAIRVGGRRAHELARRGEAVELAPRPVSVRQLELLDWSPPSFSISVRCSKGTYIRALVRDVGEQLGCGGVLSSLRRLRSGPFDLRRAITLERLSQLLDRGAPPPLLSLDEALEHLPSVDVSAAELHRLQMGQPIPTRAADEQLARIRCAEQTVALGAVENGRLRPRRQLAKVVAERPRDRAGG